MLEAVRKFGLEAPKPSKEEQEVLDALRSLSEELKGIGVPDSDTSTFEPPCPAPEPTMTNATIETFELNLSLSEHI